MGYQNRRYRVVDGKIEKRWDGTKEPGWFMTKAEAWAAVAAPVARQEAVEQPGPPPPPSPEPEPAGYETWKGPMLRSEIKARTGKGPKVGAESTKVAMIERLRELDAGAGIVEDTAPQLSGTLDTTVA